MSAQANLLAMHQQQLARLKTLTEELVKTLQDLPNLTSFNAFIQRLHEVFEHPEGGKSAGDQLLSLREGRNTAAEYALEFGTLATQTVWVDDTLKLLFRKGLNVEVQSELGCRNEGSTLDLFIDLAIRIDNTSNLLSQSTK